MDRSGAFKQVFDNDTICSVLLWNGDTLLVDAILLSQNFINAGPFN